MARLERTNERAFVLPIAGFLLFVPPLIGLFDGRATVAGIPLVLLYIFGGWMLLIAAARQLARRLLSESRDRGGRGGTAGQPASRRRDRGTP